LGYIPVKIKFSIINPLPLRAGDFFYYYASGTGDISSRTETVIQINQNISNLPEGSEDGQMLILINGTGSSKSISDSSDLWGTFWLAGHRTLILFWIENGNGGKWYAHAT